MKEVINRLNEKSIKLYFQGRTVKEKLVAVITDNRGAGESESTSAAVKILTSVVIGALMLGGLYYLINDIVLPNLNTRVENMFDFNG